MKRFSISKKDGFCDMQMMMLLMEYLIPLKDAVYDIVIDCHHEKASSKQFGWLFGGIYPKLIPEFCKLGWDEITSVDDVDAFFEMKFRGRKMVNHSTGEVIELPLSLKDMNTVEMSEYCSRILDFAQEFLGVDILPLLPEQYKTNKRNTTN